MLLLCYCKKIDEMSAGKNGKHCALHIVRFIVYTILGLEQMKDGKENKSVFSSVTFMLRLFEKTPLFGEFIIIPMCMEVQRRQMDHFIHCTVLCLIRHALA